MCVPRLRLHRADQELPHEILIVGLFEARRQLGRVLAAVREQHYLSRLSESPQQAIDQDLADLLEACAHRPDRRSPAASIFDRPRFPFPIITATRTPCRERWHENQVFCVVGGNMKGEPSSFVRTVA